MSPPIHRLTASGGCVFGKQSFPLFLCGLDVIAHGHDDFTSRREAVRQGSPYPEVTGSICLVPLHWFSPRLGCVQPVHLCRYGYGSRSQPEVSLAEGRCCFQGMGPVWYGLDTRPAHTPSHSPDYPIGYTVRFHLRDRLTLGGTPYPRNP